MDCLLSFIIPAYNAANYVSRCLDSILSLHLSDNSFEIIVIDDYSSDNTREIVKTYTAGYPFIQLLCQNANHRQGAARNRGISVAKGKYIAFIDADDIVKEGVSKALNRAIKEDLDICFYGMQHEKSDGIYREVKWNMPVDVVVDGVQFLNNYLDMDINGPTRGVFRKNLIVDNQLTFIEDVHWEDGDFCLKLYSYAKRIGNIENIGYVYKRNEQSTCLNPDSSALIDQLKLGVRLIDFVTLQGEKLHKGKEEILTDVKYRYVHNVLRLRNLSKYTAKENRSLCRALTKRDLTLLKPFALSIWETIYLSCPSLAQMPLFFICPFASLGRLIVTNIRKSKHH